MGDESGTSWMSFWEEDEQVERFATRPADHRLLGLIDAYPEPNAIRVLDLGCAGGRNSEVLAQRGFDLWALDRSAAMVRRTQLRVAPSFGLDEAEKRVAFGDMRDLERYENDFFHLVIALGIYQQAASIEDWHRAVGETARVMRPDGLLLVSGFSPSSEPDGVPMEPVPGQPHMYTGFSGRSLCSMEADVQDDSMLAHGLEPASQTKTIRVPLESGFRVTVNALYRFRHPSPSE